MKKKKKFDCIEMKDRIQRKVVEQRRGLTPEQQRQRAEQKGLADPVLRRLWTSTRRDSTGNNR